MAESTIKSSYVCEDVSFTTSSSAGLTTKIYWIFASYNSVFYIITQPRREGMAESKIQQVVSNSGTGYCKMPDGTLIQWGVNQIARNAGGNYVTATFPIAFIDIPVGFANYATSHPEIWMSSIPATTKTTIQCCLYNGSSTMSSSSEIWWFAIGRWK